MCWAISCMQHVRIYELKAKLRSELRVLLLLLLFRSSGSIAKYANEWRMTKEKTKTLQLNKHRERLRNHYEFHTFACHHTHMNDGVHSQSNSIFPVFSNVLNKIPILFSLIVYRIRVFVGHVSVFFCILRVEGRFLFPIERFRILFIFSLYFA